MSKHLFTVLTLSLLTACGGAANPPADPVDAGSSGADPSVASDTDLDADPAEPEESADAAEAPEEKKEPWIDLDAAQCTEAYKACAATLSDDANATLGMDQAAHDKYIGSLDKLDDEELKAKSCNDMMRMIRGQQFC